MLWDDRRRVGVDLDRFRRLPWLRELPVPGVLRSLLRRRVQSPPGWVLGNRATRRARDVPQLGLSDSAAGLQRIPLREGCMSFARADRSWERVEDGAAVARRRMRDDVRTGLLGMSQKELPPTYFYDATGSRLFDEITRLPEYYLTRAERRLLELHAPEIIRRTRPRALAEL